MSISVWENEADARAWGAHPEHVAVRARGWDRYYESYTMFTIVDPEVKHFAKDAG